MARASGRGAGRGNQPRLPRRWQRVPIRVNDSDVSSGARAGSFRASDEIASK